MKIVGWIAAYIVNVDPETNLGEEVIYTSREHEWRDLPPIGVAAVKAFFDRKNWEGKHNGINLCGDDWYLVDPAKGAAWSNRRDIEDNLRIYPAFPREMWKNGQWFNVEQYNPLRAKIAAISEAP